MARGWRAWLVLLAALGMAALTARLGAWQLDRAAQKQALQAEQLSQRERPPLQPGALPADASAAAAEVHRRVVVAGRWLGERTVYLENRQMNGRPGFFALTPLELPGGQGVLLVQRGWLPRDLLDRRRIVAAPPPDGEVRVAGRLALAPARLYEFDPAASGTIRQNLDVAAFAGETGLRLLPWLLVQLDSPELAPLAQDGLLRQWPEPASDIHKHHGYAFQWFALCALILGLYVWFQHLRPWRRRRAG